MVCNGSIDTDNQNYRTFNKDKTINPEKRSDIPPICRVQNCDLPEVCGFPQSNGRTHQHFQERQNQVQPWCMTAKQ
jgi:hypothetical protein